MPTAPEVLQMLATSSTKLSDALRSATLLPEVRSDPVLLAWIEHEVSGYPDDNVPEYRRHAFYSVGDASNGAWLNRGARVPLHNLSPELQDFAGKPRSCDQSIGSYEDLLASDASSFAIPWPNEGVALLNGEIAEGGTGVDETYAFLSVRLEVPRTTIQEILDKVRQRALAEIADRVDPEQLATRIVEELPSAPAPVAVQGNANQIIMGSPGASATLTVDAGDWSRLSEALASLGISSDAIDELGKLLEDESDEPGRIMRALAWSRRAAAALGVNTAGSAAATLILQYLDQLP